MFSNGPHVSSNVTDMDVEDPQWLFQDYVHDDIVRHIIAPQLDNCSFAAFSKVNTQTWQWSAHDRRKRVLQAVVQGNEKGTKALLQSNPGLLLKPQAYADLEVTDYSGRKYKGLTPFQLALCAWDVEMCEMMKAYFLTLPNGQAELEAQFDVIFPKGIEAHIEKQKANVFVFAPILQAIIAASDNEVQAALDKDFDNDSPLSQAFKVFREEFAKKSLPEMVFNPYHLLHALETYDREFDNLQDWNKRDLFWRQVIGFTQRYLPSCFLQAFAQGLYNIVKNNESLRRSFEFKDGVSILPSASNYGLGFDYAADCPTPLRCLRAGPGERSLADGPIFRDFISSKHIKLSEITRPAQAAVRWTSCVIL